MTLNATVELEGPMPNPSRARQRSVKYINIGFIQYARFSEKTGTYADGQQAVSSLQDGSWYIDYATGNSTLGLPRSTAPWYDSNNSFTNSFRSWAVDPPFPLNFQLLSMKDTPALNRAPGFQQP